MTLPLLALVAYSLWPKTSQTVIEATGEMFAIALGLVFWQTFV